ncbi:MAG: AAA domain-containing protein [Lachnospiraceae bacterium]|nr:AAA domain-containing protein [Lachnospiraceae bacterium]
MRLNNEEQEQAFREWMRKQYNDGGIRRYTDNAIIAYSHALRTGCRMLEPYVAGNLFFYKNGYEFDSIYEQLQGKEEFRNANEAYGNGTLAAAIQLYQAFLRGTDASQAPQVSAPFYLKQDIRNEAYDDDQGLDFRYEEIPMCPLQKIYYGAPGTGKSYRVNKMLEKEYPIAGERDAHCKRLIFHPTYTYQDFVGSIKPLVTQDRPLDYIFAAGPLTLLLKEAFMHPSEKYYLIIEEINRGNAPAIFGDLFQLLDRQSSGKSEYPVANNDITAFFSRDPGLKKLFMEGKVWFPANFNILATMNTADENIFVLDNAFKRRFALEYVRINFDDLPQEWNHPYDTFAGRRPLTAIFQGTPLEDFVSQLYYEGHLSRDWPTFARLVNKLIDMVNRQQLQEMAERSDTARRHLSRIPENKKLGPFFVSEADLCQRDSFLNKVVFYLKQDVFPDHPHYLIDSYEELYLTYQEDGADLFELLR